MTIIWHGQSLFELTSSRGKNNQVNIVIDPFSQEVGLRLPKLEPNIVLSTHEHYDHNNVKAVGGNYFLIEGPGEYEIREIFIQGIPAFHDDLQGKERGKTTIFTIEAEELRLCHLGDLGQKELTPDQLEKIGEIDILMIPIGGNYTISGKEAVKIMSQIEPKIIIPIHFDKVGEKNSLKDFLEEAGDESSKAVDKLTIKRKDIADKSGEVVVLKSSN